MYYADGSVYEGEWYDDKRNGRGLLRMGEIKGNDTIHCTLLLCRCGCLTTLPQACWSHFSQMERV